MERKSPRQNARCLIRATGGMKVQMEGQGGCCPGTDAAAETGLVQLILHLAFAHWVPNQFTPHLLTEIKDKIRGKACYGRLPSGE